jgi:hypothetical protein
MQTIFTNTPEFITSLPPNYIFTFGSNKSGIHGAGAARFAHKNFGAVYGEGKGITGRCYAFPTKDYNIISMSLEEIEREVVDYYNLAASPAYSDKTFLTTKVGCGLAGFNPKQIGDLFRKHVDIRPKNVILPIEFE